MRKIITLAAAWVCIVGSAYAVPLTWRFSGTANAASQYNGLSIGGHSFELRIFLDTDLVPVDPSNLADTFFIGPHQAEVEIDTLGVLAVNPFGNVQYFDGGIGIQFNQPAFSDITFAAPVTGDIAHLSAIAPVAPLLTDNTFESGVFGPGGLVLFGPISSFSATLENGGGTPVPDAGATIVFLSLALGALRFVRCRS